MSLKWLTICQSQAMLDLALTWKEKHKVQYGFSIGACKHRVNCFEMCRSWIGYKSFSLSQKYVKANRETYGDIQSLAAKFGSAICAKVDEEVDKCQ